MKPLSPWQRRWLNSLRTHEDSQPRCSPSPRKKHHSTAVVWGKGLTCIGGALLLFSLSFSPAWALPVELRLPPERLIPEEEVLRQESQGELESEGEGPSETDEHQPVVESTEMEERDSDNEQNEREIQETETPVDQAESSSREIQQPDNADSQTAPSPAHPEPTIPQQNHSPTSPPSTSVDSDLRASQHQTENGGTLPQTATSHLTMFLHGMALMLLGLGLRTIHQNWKKKRAGL